jgi:hypothetical protein
MTHPSILKARAMIDRLGTVEAEYAERVFARESGQLDAQQQWQRTRHSAISNYYHHDNNSPKTVRERQLSAEDADMMISDLRDELIAIIQDRIAELRDEFEAFAVDAAATAAEEAGKLMGEIESRMENVAIAAEETGKLLHEIESRMEQVENRFGPKLVTKDAG